jgi:hypothetical protein
MFLGHFAIALAACRTQPGVPLGTAFVAAQLPDVVWPYLLLSGLERVTIDAGATAVTPLRFDHYPWSHSLFMVVVWALLFTLLYGFISGRKWATLLLMPLAVSHWLLDVVSHHPDLPLLPSGGRLLGLGLWSSLPLTLLVEGGLFAGALWLFARGRRFGASFWALVGTLVLLYGASIFGPPPPSVSTLAISLIVAMPILWVWGNQAGQPRST